MENIKLGESETSTIQLTDNRTENVIHSVTDNEEIIPSSENQTNLQLSDTSLPSDQTLDPAKKETINDSPLQFGTLETVALDVHEVQLSDNENVDVKNKNIQINTMQEISDDSNKYFNSEQKHGSEHNKAYDDPTPEQPSIDEEPKDNEELPVLTKYFTNVAPETSAMIDPIAEDFFNTVASKLSPIANNVSEIAVIQNSESSTQDIQVESTNFQDTSFSIEEDSDATEDLQERDKINDGCQSEELPSSRKQSTEREDKNSLSKFFSDEKGGSDPEGKAFFDALAGIGTTGSAFIIGSLHGNDHQNTPTFPTAPISPQEDISNNNKNEYYYDAWIPSHETQEILAAVSKASPGTYFGEKDQLTMPGIIIEEDLEDPVKSLISEILPQEAKERNVLNTDSVTQDEVGLRQLIAEGCYHAAVNLTTRLLTSAGQGPGQGGHPSRNTPYTFQLWFTRLALLIQLRKFSFAEVESEIFDKLDQPDVYYEFYPDIYKGRKGSMASFSFRLLMAELPQYQGNHQKTLNRLYHLLGIVQTMLQNLKNGLSEDGNVTVTSESVRKASIALWEERECRVLYSLVNCVVSLKDYVMAVKLMDILLQKSKDQKSELYSAFGRLYLQLGDVKAAQECFSRATTIRLSLPKELSHEVEELINKAMMAIAQNGYADAYNYYKQAYSLQSNKPMLLNNMAICLLYMGKLKESLALLEKTVQGNPPMCLHNGIIFNICTLYELESSQSSARKQAMLSLVSKYAPDNFNTWCLKIQLSR